MMLYYLKFITLTNYEIFCLFILLFKITHKNNSKPKTTTKSITNFTIIKLTDFNWCTIKKMSVTIVCESDIVLITTYLLTIGKFVLL